MAQKIALLATIFHIRNHFTMDSPTALIEINSLSVDERIQLVEAIWDGIAAEPGQPVLTDAQLSELKRRVASHRAFPENVVPWEEVKSQALARARK